MTPDSNFRHRLRQARRQRELTQVQLAKKAGFKPAAISHFETGHQEPNLTNLRKLARGLRVTSDYLLGMDGRLKRKGGGR